MLTYCFSLLSPFLQCWCVIIIMIMIFIFPSLMQTPLSTLLHNLHRPLLINTPPSGLENRARGNGIFQRR